jgi:hypothetical protein
MTTLSYANQVHVWPSKKEPGQLAYYFKKFYLYLRGQFQVGCHSPTYIC